MALGTAKLSSEYLENIFKGSFNHSTDVFKWVFSTDTYASIDTEANTLNMSTVTKVPTAGNYVQDTILSNTSLVRVSNVSSFSFDDFSFAAGALNPITPTTLIIYNDTSALDEIVLIVDLTTDGTTPADTTLGFSYALPAGGSFDITN